MRQIGLLGGSFDPIHVGHLNMAMQAWKEYHLDEVWLIPSGHSPHKNEDGMTDAWIRTEMAALAIGTSFSPDEWKKNVNLSKTGSYYPYMRVCSIELSYEETSYTYRTLEKLAEQFPECQFSFLMGADSLDYFEKWVQPQRIGELARILVINRDQFSKDDLIQKIEQLQQLFSVDIRIVHCGKTDAASHDIRGMIQNGVDCRRYLTSDVWNYIEEQHLYHA